MENPPDAPDEIPQYIIDALHRQSRDSLEHIEQYAAQLRAEKTRRENEAITNDEVTDDTDNGNIEDIDRSGDGTVVIKTVPCGKDCNGCPHGPYKYTVKRVNGDLEWTYHPDWSP